MYYLMEHAIMLIVQKDKYLMILLHKENAFQKIIISIFLKKSVKMMIIVLKLMLW